jgi:hypothetical protein
MSTIAMIRDAKQFPDSHDANVHPDNVAEFEAAGWTRRDPLDHDSDGRKGGSKKKAAAPAPVEDTDPLDIPQDAAGGLTIRELHASLEGVGVEFDPAADVAVKFGQLTEAREILAA